MHSFETKLREILENGQEPVLADFGSATDLHRASSDIAKSPLMPEFLKVAIAALPDTLSPDKDLLAEFVCNSIGAATDDFALMEAIDLLYEYGPLPGDSDNRCFVSFLNIASRNDVSAMAKAVALEGAFRWALSERRRQLQLLNFLLGLQNNEDPSFLARAAKIMGVAYSHWREEELIKILSDLTKIEGVQDEAAYELGMAKLTNGLETVDRANAAEEFESAKYWFTVSAEHREQRPDAIAYISCLSVLTAFSQGKKHDHLNEIATSITEAAFQMDAWHTSPTDPHWLGARRAENACWTTLALKLKNLSFHLDELSWWEPAIVIEEHLIASYTASRSILKRARYGGIEALIRPPIEGALSRSEGQAYHLKTWLRLNSDHEWSEEAMKLLHQVDDIINGGPQSPPGKAATVWPPVAALLETARIPDAAKEAILETLALHLANRSVAELSLMDNCLLDISRHPDYRDNPNGKCLFDVVLNWTIRFLNSRLEMTRGDDSGVNYLFERDDGSLPPEEDLQDDYYRFMFANVTGTEIEISNIGGGRVDVRFVYGGERLIVEVKRESVDSSFSTLQDFYAAQATDYQNVSIRLGFLLVLDQTEIRDSGTPHISTLVHTSQIVRRDESEPRWLVIIKIPGRRLAPSDLTRSAKKRKAASKRAKAS